MGFNITRNGIKLVDKKVRTILDLDRLQNIRDTRRVLGIVQYYHDLWRKHSHFLALLSDLIGLYSPKKPSSKKGKYKAPLKNFV